MVLYKIITEYFTTSTISIMFSKVGLTSVILIIFEFPEVITFLHFLLNIND